MSAIANIAIVDGQATPVTHTFIPFATNPNPSWREAQSGLALVGQPWMVITVKQDTGNGLNKVRVVLDLPALETITGQNAAGYTAAPKVAYDNKVVMDFFLPSRGTAAQRKDLRVLSSNLLLNSQIVDIIENLVFPY